MGKLILIRHGESLWNLQNRFAGWVDIGLSTKGIEEAKKAGIALKDYHYDDVYVSHMLRAIETMCFILWNSNDQRTPIIYHEDDPQIRAREHYVGNLADELPVFQTKLLAERFYGDLQGLNKKDTTDKYGAEQVHLWRRSFDVKPPGGDSLKDTLERVLPYFEEKIEPDLKKGKTILIVAHGNSSRAIMKHIEKISDEDIPNHEIPTGIPIVYELDENMNLLSKKELE